VGRKDHGRGDKTGVHGYHFGDNEGWHITVVFARHVGKYYVRERERGGHVHIVARHPRGARQYISIIRQRFERLAPDWESLSQCIGDGLSNFPI